MSFVANIYVKRAVFRKKFQLKKLIKMKLTETVYLKMEHFFVREVEPLPELEELNGKQR